MRRSRTSPVVGLALVAVLAGALPLVHLVASQRAAGASRKNRAQVLLVQDARSASLQDGRLTLDGVGPTAIYLADRPPPIDGYPAAAVVELGSPVVDGDRLTYRVRVLRGKLPAAAAGAR